MILGDVLFITNFTDRGINLVTWSLSHEMQYYILAPFVFFIFRTRTFASLIISICFVWVLYVTTLSGWLAHFSYLYTFVLGYSVNIILHLVKVRLTELTKIFGLLIGVAALNSVYNWLTISPYAEWALPAATIICVILVYIMECPCGFEITGNNRFAARVAGFAVLTGELSFGLYLWHYVFIRTRGDIFQQITDIFLQHFGIVELLQKSLVFHTVQISIVLVWSYILAYASFRLIERRFRPALYDRETVANGVASPEVLIARQPQSDHRPDVIGPKPIFVASIIVVVLIGLAFIARVYIQAPEQPAAGIEMSATTTEIWSDLGERLLPSQPLASSGAPLEIVRLTDGNPQTWWSSAEKGDGVKDHAWIGARFTGPVKVGSIMLRQTWNKPFRQDQVRVQSSEDGTIWRDALPTPVPTIKDETIIPVVNATAAAWWRLVAAADNSAARSDANWTPLDIFFFTTPSALR